MWFLLRKKSIELSFVVFSVCYAFYLYCPKMFKGYCNKEISCHENMTEHLFEKLPPMLQLDPHAAAANCCFGAESDS